MLGFLPTRAYRPGTPGATTFLSPLSGTFNYGWDSFAVTVSATLLVAQVVTSIEVTPTGPFTLTSVGATQSLSAVAKDEGGTAISSVTSFTWVSDAPGRGNGG